MVILSIILKHISEAVQTKMFRKSLISLITERLVILLTTINYIMQKHHNQQKIKDMIGLIGREPYQKHGKGKILGLGLVVG